MKRLQTGNDVRRLPDRHRLVRPAPIEIRADGAQNVADESKHLIVRRRPFEVAVIGDVAIKRSWRSVDQFGHRGASISSLEGAGSDSRYALDVTLLGRLLPLRR